MSRKNKIYCSLNGNGINDKDYQHVLEVWNKFEMKTTKDYRDLHLQCDVLMLADGFDQFRNRCGKKFGLCPSHYLSTPALCWDAMLSMTKVELCLVSEIDTNLFLETCSIRTCFLKDTAKQTINI